jgi:hypothetical protein
MARDARIRGLEEDPVRCRLAWSYRWLGGLNDVRHAAVI